MAIAVPPSSVILIKKAPLNETISGDDTLFGAREREATIQLNPIIVTSRILAISGSLRAASTNTALLRAAARLAPAGIEITLFEGLGLLPLFNPDIEATEPPPVASLRQQIKASDGLIIASPEYAHGVAGAIKNALDWMVSGEEFVNKPVALFNASPRATHAYAALKETVTVMSARIVEEASIAVPILGRNLDTTGIVTHLEISVALRAAIVALAQATLG
jgi:NAD(P)H-dependent FMN reductase